MFRCYLKNFLLFILLIFSFHLLNNNAEGKDLYHSREINTQNVSQKLKLNLDYGNIPLYFIANEGQVHKQALFYSKTPRYTLWITQEGLVFDAIKKADSDSRPQGPEDRNVPQELTSKRDVSRLVFLGANKRVRVESEGLTEHRVNYFIGKDPTKWKTGIRSSKAVVYRDIYEGIDLKIYGTEREIEYDWVVNPGADPKSIKFKLNDVRGTRIDDGGNLVIETEFGEILHKKPESYQVIEGKKIEVESEFIKSGEDTYTIRVEKYNRDYKLFIDPLVLVYSTYLGGGNSDRGYGIAVDSSGNAYVTGYTCSTDFPTSSAYDSSLGAYIDAFVSKLSSNGSTLIYSTYLGGGGNDDVGLGIAVDSSGNAYVTGYTCSTDFPTPSGYDSSYNGGYDDAFVSKLSSDGSTLIYSTYCLCHRRDIVH